MLTPEDVQTVAGMLSRLGTFMTRTVKPNGVGLGQLGEMNLIRPLLPPDPATYVDIGAGDPESCSNTWGLYQDGWHGLLIEPLPTFWYGLLRHRPRDRTLPIAVGNYTGPGRLRACGPCSSMRPDWAIQEQAELLVEVDTLANILADYPEIRDRCQLCSIDVEGMERQVLEGIDWDTFRPTVFVVEYLSFVPAGLDEKGVDLSHEWEPLLLAQGYRRAGKTPLNYIYTNAPTAEEVAAAKAEQEAAEAAAKAEAEKEDAPEESPVTQE